MPRGRKHHNNDGRQMLKTGSRAKRTAKLAKKLGVEFKLGKPSSPGQTLKNEAT